MAKTLEDLGYHASLILDNDYLLITLQTTIRGKNGFLEVRQGQVSPVYKIENDTIKSMAVIGVDHYLIEELVESISREDIIKSFININNGQSHLKIAFYNRNQPIDKMLKFYEFKEPINIDEQLFTDLGKYLF